MTTAERNSIRETDRERIMAPCIGGYPLTAAERNRICSPLLLLIDDASVFLEQNDPKMALDKSLSALYLTNRLVLRVLPEDEARRRFQEWVYWLRQHLTSACGYSDLNMPKKALEQIGRAKHLAQQLSPHPSQP